MYIKYIFITTPFQTYLFDIFIADINYISYLKYLTYEE